MRAMSVRENSVGRQVDVTVRAALAVLPAECISADMVCAATTGERTAATRLQSKC